MKIQFCSDLHLEFEENRKHLLHQPLVVSGDILILAGDIVPFTQFESVLSFFELWSTQFKDVFWLAGNHEFYGSDISQTEDTRDEIILGNVHIVNNCVYKIHDIVLIFSTLWSRVDEVHASAITNGMADFRMIHYKDRMLDVHEYNRRHAVDFAFLQRVLEEFPGKKSLVVTHHIPTFLNYPEKYITDILRFGFATEYAEWIENKGPTAWIYGHHHFNQLAFRLGTTKMLTNQLGYMMVGGCKYFDLGKSIEL